MKTIEEFRVEVAAKYGYTNWIKFIEECPNWMLVDFIDEVAKEHAKKTAIAQIQKCAEEYAKPYDGLERERVLVILNTPLVTD